MRFKPLAFARTAVQQFFAKRKAQAPAPTWLWVMLVVGLLAGAGLSTLRGAPQASAEALGLPPSVVGARLLSLDEPVALAKILNLVVQSHDAQPGLSLRYGQLNYEQLTAWMDLSLALDPTGQYPLLAGARLYTQNSADRARQRKMTDWVATRFLDDPARRWPWIAHVAYVAKTQFKDMSLAMRYAETLRNKTERLPDVPAWARQMDIFLKIEMKDSDTAKFLIGGLLQSGQIKDPNELRFLAHTLKELEEGRR
ncbi:MAG: hypothetical protein QM533_10860 [Cytophagales bacterium]|nr:hypothetical protein [Cytophagales bacterium]